MKFASTTALALALALGAVAVTPASAKKEEKAQAGKANYSTAFRQAAPPVQKALAAGDLATAKAGLAAAQAAASTDDDKYAVAGMAYQIATKTNDQAGAAAAVDAMLASGKAPPELQTQLLTAKAQNSFNNGKFADADALARAAFAQWPQASMGRPYVVCTGGEPLLQLDAAAIAALHGMGFEIGIETNGTLLPPPGIDWICVSPKAGSTLVQKSGDELKLVWPQPGSDVATLVELDFAHRLIQPLDDPHAAANVQACIDLVMADPRWRLSLQTHKSLGLR